MEKERTTELGTRERSVLIIPSSNLQLCARTSTQVDVKCISAGSELSYYPEHLPVLGTMYSTCMYSPRSTHMSLLEI